MSRSVNPLTAIAITPDLDKAHLQILAECLPTGSDALAYLATRPDLNETIADLLITRVGGRARAATIRHVTDPEKLRHLYTKKALQPAVCANPNTPVDILLATIETLSGVHYANEAVLQAACNPSTPLEARQKYLNNKSKVAVLVSVSSPLALAVGRSYALVENNQWMLNDSLGWGSNIRRALVSRPNPATELFDNLCNDSFAASRVPGMHRHPLRQSKPVSDLSVDELLVMNNVAADLEIVSRVGFDVNTATKLIHRTDYHPEPHIIARCLNLYGVAPILGGKSTPMWAGTRVMAASWLEPFAAYLHQLLPTWISAVDLETFIGCRTAVESSQNFFRNLHQEADKTREVVNTLIALSKDWAGDMQSLLDASFTL